MINHPQPRKEVVFTCDGDDLENIELPRMKKNQETEADFSSYQSCYIAHVIASSMLTYALIFPNANMFQSHCCHGPYHVQNHSLRICFDDHIQDHVRGKIGSLCVNLSNLS